MWYLWEASNGKLHVMCERQEMDPWKMCKSKEDDREFGERLCGGCKKQADGLMDSMEELCEEGETMRGFCYLGDRVNAAGGYAAAVTARARISWVKFRECGELLNSKRFSMKLKGMLYGSETWCLRENENIK